MHDLDADELRRLNTWTSAIAQALCPEAPVAISPEGLRLGRKGSLAITVAGGWYDHESGRGDRDAQSLIRHLRNCATAEAAAWARTWLDMHPGDGELSAEGAAEAAAEAGQRRAAFARQIVEEAIDPLGTPGEAYLRSRGVEPPYPGCIRWLPDARIGEGALVGIITTADGEAVGAQLGYLDSTGRKTTVRPYRQLFLLDKEKAKQGAFHIPVAEPIKDAVPLVIIEGIENALSIAQGGAAKTVMGFPGVGRFGKFDLPSGINAVIFKDGDAPDTGAKELASAADRWLLAGARVRVTDTPEDADANSILQDQGADELRRLVAEAEPAALSFNADVERLAGLEPVDYERERTKAAGRHNVRVAFLDAAVKATRAEAKAATAEEDADEALYPEPVADLGQVLDQALLEMQRYVVVSEPELAAAVLWAVHAHLVHHELVRLPVSPKLAIQSPDRGCGKTTLLEVIGSLVPRPETGSSITAAATFRLIEARRPSLLIDEADRVLRSSNDELIAVLNSSHRRSGAYVWRVEEMHGERVPCRFSTWAAVAFAGIKELPITLQDRSIVIRLVKAKPGEVKAHLRNGTSQPLRTLKQKFARWAADLIRLPEAQLPAGLHNRTGDNWLPLFAIATAAGGRWPTLVNQAALSAVTADQRESELVALLDGIRRAFGERDQLRTRELLDCLLAEDEHDWGVANRGKPVNDAWLRQRLRNVITPAADGKAGSERWGSRNNKERGYSRARFDDAWARYLPSFEETPNHPVHPVHPAPPLKNKGNAGPDEPKNTRPQSNNTRSRARRNGGGPDAKPGVAGCKSGHAAQKTSIKSKQWPGAVP